MFFKIFQILSQLHTKWFGILTPASSPMEQVQVISSVSESVGTSTGTSNLKIIYLFIYLFIWLCRVLVAAHGIFVAARGI